MLRFLAFYLQVVLITPLYSASAVVPAPLHGAALFLLTALQGRWSRADTPESS